jgi:hypothetical protein
MSVFLENNNTAAGALGGPIINVPLLPIIANRVPGPNDKAPLGQIWIVKNQNLVYMLTSIVDNEANWEIINQGDADFVDFTAQTVGNVVEGVAEFPMAQNSGIVLLVNMIATRDDFSEGGGYLLQAAFRREGANAPVIIGAVNEIVSDDDFAGGDPQVTLEVVGNSVLLDVTGLAGVTINWKASITNTVIT